MTTVNVSISSDLIDIVSYLNREFNNNISYQLDSFDFIISVKKQYDVVIKITIRMGEYTIYSNYSKYNFNDEEFFDINQFFSHTELTKLLEQIKRDLNESN